MNIQIKNYNETHAIIVEDEIIDFTTNYDEIEDIIIEFCEDNNIDTWDVNITEN